jgi:hypothetical protein
MGKELLYPSTISGMNKKSRLATLGPTPNDQWVDQLV